MDSQTITLDQSTKQLDQLLPLIKDKPTPKGLNYAASLLIHRCRLQLFNALLEKNKIQQVIAITGDTEEQAKVKKIVSDNFWVSTDLTQLQENVNFLKSESRIELNQFKAEPGIQQNLPLAMQLLAYSREISPLQPWVHLRLAQLNAIIGDPNESDRCIQRALEVAPKNPQFQNIAGIYYLQSNRPKLASEHFRRYLELQPNKFAPTMNIVTGRSNRSIEPIPAEMIGGLMLPDNPAMLFSYATRYRIADDEQKRATLERAATILDNLEFREDKDNKLLGDIRNLQGEPEKAVDAYDDYLLIYPHDLKYFFKRAQLLEQLGRYRLALEDANRLANRAAKPQKYRDFAREIRRKLSEREEKRR